MYTVPKLTDYSSAALEKAASELLAALEAEAAAVRSETDWKEFRDRWMARKNGVLTQVNDLWLKAAPKDAKRDVGQRVNELKAKVEQGIDAALGRAKGGESPPQINRARDAVVCGSARIDGFVGRAGGRGGGGEHGPVSLFW